MPTISELVVLVQANTAQFNQAMAKTAATTTSTTSGMSGALSKFGIGATAIAGAAGIALVKFGADAVKSFEESQQVMAQTEAVLKSTGQAAGVTAKDVTTFAATWQNLTGVQDEAIQSSENLLLTFRDVHNEVGKGNDIFNQAEVAILDMSTALNRGATPSAEQLQSATIQLGKALNDPITGMTALKRVGVSFNESQIATIKSLQASGDLMGAQKIILGELQSEFGGAAKAAGQTFAGQMAILNAKFDDFKEKIGAAIVPALLSLMQLVEDLVARLHDLSGALDFTPGVLQLVSNLDKVRSAGEDTGGVMGFLHKTFIETIPIFYKSGSAAGKSADEMSKLTGALGDLGDPAQFATNVTVDLADAQKKAADAARDQRLAILGLTNSFFGIMDSANQVTEAQQALNDLQKHGKRGTEEYKDAVLEALKAQAGLEGAVLSYAKELSDSGETQKNVIDKVKNLATELGLQRSDFQSLIGKVKEYINTLNSVPSSLSTTANLVFSVGGVTHAQHGFHGTVRGPRMFLAGEAGPERVDIGPSEGSGMGGVVGPITIEVAGQVLARVTRDELLKLAARNATTGL